MKFNPNRYDLILLFAVVSGIYYVIDETLNNAPPRRTADRWTRRCSTAPSGLVPYQGQAVPAWRLVQDLHITSSSTARAAIKQHASRSARSTRRLP